MDQIANLVIDLGIDAAEFKNEIPRIKNLLNGAASDAERSSARMQRFMERQTQAARQTTQAASSAATAFPFKREINKFIRDIANNMKTDFFSAVTLFTDCVTVMLWII